MHSDPSPQPFPLRIYRRVESGMPGESPSQAFLLVKFHVYLPDQPGSLAGFASDIAATGGNVSFFHYDRSVDASRVAVEVQFSNDQGSQALTKVLEKKHYSSELLRTSSHEVEVVSLENVLEVKVRLQNRPGALAAFADLLSQHGANVIYMLYDEEVDAGSADIAMATKDTAEITRLMEAMNEQGHHYRVIYRGADAEGAAQVIGLKMVEKFFLRLKRLLPESDIEDLRSLVRSSAELEQDLVRFYTEAGKNLEAGDVFEKVLALASRSRAKTGVKFRVLEMPPREFPGKVKLLSFRLPTSENFFLFVHGSELTMIDTGHGVYYEDIKGLLRKKQLDPAAVRRIFITHPDTDHAGGSGYFQQEFGTEVYMHPGADEVIRNMNRGVGASGDLLNLNKYYTRLSSRFTECRFPERITYFPVKDPGRAGRFRTIADFDIGPLRFEAVESLGGHTPGLVFYLNRQRGLLFTSDFLLNVPSLSADEKEHLNIYRYLLTNPNRDTRVYMEETEALKELAQEVQQSLVPAGRKVTIFPGHGAYYEG